MQTQLTNLAQIRPWCQSAKIGEAEEFLVQGQILQTDATDLAHQINNDLPAEHVWLTVKKYSPTASTTTLEARKSH